MGNKTNYVRKGQVQFYKDLTSETGVNSQELMQKISISIKLLQCDLNASYSFIALLTEGTMNKTIGTSEKIIAKNPKEKFANSFLVEYFFEKNQPFTLQFSKTTSSGVTTQYTLSTSLGSIVGSKKNTLLKKLEENSLETVKVKAKELKAASEYINFKFEAKKTADFTDKHNSFYYLISGKTKLYQSESLPLNGSFEPKMIPLDLVGDKFQLDFFDYKNKLVNSTQYQLNSFIGGVGGSKITDIPVRLSSKITLALTNMSRKIKRESFIEYLRSGIKLNLTIGIDYTASNLKPNDPKSLHYLDQNTPNDYQRAIRSCGDIVAFYDYDQLFPVYGFGAKLPNTQEVAMCFHVNNQPDPNIYTINQVLDLYQNTLPYFELSGPTHFAPMINKCIETIKAESNKLNYHILMILTDGIINDMDKTIDALVEASFLPLSVIIIGIGSADFSNMDTLDADDEPLISSNNTKAARDLVQFVPFSKFQHDGNKLAEEVLAEIPRQLVDYYQMNNFSASELTQ